MKRALASTLVLAFLTGCSTESRSPDAIRHDTAVATAAAARDAKAVAQGVFDGVRSKGPININRASAEDLAALPGLDDDTARRIIDGRPYSTSAELVHRHILTRTQYNGIANKVVAR